MHVNVYIRPACTLCPYQAYTKYSVLMNVSFCLYIMSICMYAVNNHIILTLNAESVCQNLHWNLGILQKSSFISGNLAEIFIYIWKSSRNLHLYLEILHNLSGNPETLHEILKSAWNLKMFLKSSEIPRFRNLVQIFSSDQLPH